MAHGPSASDAPCVFPGSFWRDVWDFWVLPIHRVMSLSNPARRLPHSEGTFVEVRSHLEQEQKAMHTGMH